MMHIKEIPLRDLRKAGQNPLSFFSSTSLKAEEKRYHVDSSRLVHTIYPRLPIVAADLLNIAASVTWADRNDRRPLREVGKFRQYRGWARKISLIIGVREPDRWQDKRVKETLQDLLYWLTEDIWELDFRYEPIHSIADVQPVLFGDKKERDALIVLYSGGLDSLAGAVTLRNLYPEREIVLLSVIADRLAFITQQQYCSIQSLVSRRELTRYAPLHFHLVHKKKTKTKQDEEKANEDSQRTRGFLFFASGLAQALVYNSKRILMCENGVGMLNLPFNKRQLGVQHTRSVHPQTILQLNQLLNLLELSDIRYEAPFLALTKGQLCQVLGSSKLAHRCNDTISCDSFPVRKKRPVKDSTREWHCGTCSSCLLRRQSIFASELSGVDDENIYKWNVCEPNWTKYKGDNEALLMMLDQVTEFQHLLFSEDPIPDLLCEFPELYMACHSIDQQPELFGLDASSKSIDVIATLLRTYVDEWGRFPYQVV